ncbi:TetR/AcrR family transcriptional regulator [Rhabdaerophilum sp. SD176]|uniref:TetR/AcrR family transcriptional regulator n=1 Tax=Rhabdaerophilum sp. SD176 TaxID=2983548 RepID=UPI0024DF52D4|nr:TetR/AcrR family transcriptional regulator [Rhabdaerophilum sp. SD176]
MSRSVNAREKLLEAAVKVVRSKGFAATSVDDLCVEAGVTKGAFFHHFASKEALGIAAAEYWSKMTGALFAAAPYQQVEDPLERLLAYLRFRRDILGGELCEFTCLAGTMLQEVYAQHPAIAAACQESIASHAATLEPMISAAMLARGLDPEGASTGWTASGLALHSQVVLQGAFILAKGSGGPAIARDSVDHLTRYIRLLFTSAGANPDPSP